MPDTWTILKGNSTLLTGDAWEHLNHQDGSGGPLEPVLAVTYLVAEADTVEVTADVPVNSVANAIAKELTAELGEVLSAEVNTKYTAEANAKYTTEV